MSVKKADLVAMIAEEIGPKVTKKDIGTIVNLFLDGVSEMLQQDKRIEIRGFGAFMVKERKPKLGRNPKTREPVPIPARKVPVFKPSKLLRAKIAK